MLDRLILATVFGCAIATQPGSERPLATPPPSQPAHPESAPKEREPLTLAAIFKDDAARKEMGLDKLSPQEQDRLAFEIIKLATRLQSAKARGSHLRQEAVLYLTSQGWEEDPIRKMQSEGWSEVEILGTVIVKGDRFVLDRELLSVRVFGRRSYYGSGFRDELSGFDKANLRSGTMWGKDMFRSLTIIGMDGSEVDLRRVDLDTLP